MDLQISAALIENLTSAFSLYLETEQCMGSFTDAAFIMKIYQDKKKITLLKEHELTGVSLKAGN